MALCKHSFGSTVDSYCRYYIAQADQRLWVTSMESIHSISLEEEAQSFHKKYHDLTCCGIDFHPNVLHCLNISFHSLLLRVNWLHQVILDVM